MGCLQRFSTAISRRGTVSVTGYSCSIKYHSPTSAEVYWIGIDPAYHRQGLGRGLMGAAINDARARGVRYLFVATLHPDVEYEPFLRTRRFYEDVGFVYAHEEHFPADPANPIAYYLKQL
jgi:GNAT superfamily N-acetyltransferase